jgi:hypothetical protein
MTYTHITFTVVAETFLCQCDKPKLDLCSRVRLSAKLEKDISQMSLYRSHRDRQLLRDLNV